MEEVLNQIELEQDEDNWQPLLDAQGEKSLEKSTYRSILVMS
ncbi:hypothetical protein OL548_00210 [Lysinibacillus sp. MHQ-1]|nr:hypothetical protein OL548_00210 [Lysinibacillus sp. MHQ-1]